MKNEVEQESLDIAIKEATEELSHRKTYVDDIFCFAMSPHASQFRLGGSMSGGSAVYESLLRVGKQKKLCTACNRHLDDQELIVFEKYVRLLQ